MGRTSRRYEVAAIQMTSTGRVARNVAEARRRVERAVRAGARLVALPENFAYLRGEGRRGAFAETLEGELVSTFREEARRLDCYLLLGSIPEKIPRRRRIHNTSVLISPRGSILAAYRKMHLFDVRLRGAAVFQESRFVAPGDEPVVVETPLGRLGLSICYDLRFPEYYRRLALAGAEVVFVPAAFTACTGPHHWLPLLRARAIENQCWVVAPAQVGRHNAARRSHGETAIVDPWGRVTALGRRAAGALHAMIDRDEVARIRRGMPCLDHVRPRLLGGAPRD